MDARWVMPTEVAVLRFLVWLLTTQKLPNHSSCDLQMTTVLHLLSIQQSVSYNTHEHFTDYVQSQSILNHAITAADNVQCSFGLAVTQQKLAALYDVGYCDDVAYKQNDCAVYRFCASCNKQQYQQCLN